MVYQKDIKYFQDFLPLSEPTDVSGWEHTLGIYIPVLGNYNRELSNEIPDHHEGYLNPASEVKISSYTDPIKVDSFKDSLGNSTSYSSNLFNSDSSIELDLAVTRAAKTRKYSGVKDTSKETTALLTKGLDPRIFSSSSIDASLSNLLDKANTNLHWFEEHIHSLTVTNIYLSLVPELKTLLSKLTFMCGDNIDLNVVLGMLYTRILSGEMDSFDVDYLEELVDYQTARLDDKKVFQIAYSTNAATNYKFANSYALNFSRELDPDAHSHPQAALLTNYKVPAIDIDAHIPIIDENNISRKLNFNRNEAIIIKDSGRVGFLTLKDGYFVTIFDSSGTNRNAYANTTVNNSWWLPQKHTQRIFGLLGDHGTTHISVETDTSAGVDFTSNLNTDNTADRPPYYFFKLDLSGEGIPNPQKKRPGVNTTVCKYSRINTSAVNTADLQRLLDIRYASPSTFIAFVEHDDLICDYWEIANTLTAEIPNLDLNKDSVENLEAPNFPRSIPRSIMIIPTDKCKYNPFKLRSYLSNFEADGKAKRRLDFAPHFDSAIGEIPIDDIFDVYTTSDVGGSEDIYGGVDSSGIYSYITSAGTDAGFWTSGFYTSSSTKPSRPAQPLRVLAQIITELKTNYNLTGDFLDWFTVLSRLKSNEYAVLTKLDKAQKLFDLIEKGLFGVKVSNIHKSNTDVITSRTSLRTKKSGAADDVYYPIKLAPIRDNNKKISPVVGAAILPPTETEAVESPTVLFNGDNIVGTIFPTTEEETILTESRVTANIPPEISRVEPVHTAATN
jgi:hypothetical protein